MRAGPSYLLALALLGSAPASGLTPRLVKDINTVPLAQGSFPQGYAVAGGLAFFAAGDGERGSELWRTDGTAAGTFQVADACPGECGSSPVVVAQAGNSVFFQAFGRGFGPVDLWITDGSAAGTLRLAGPLLLPDAGSGSLWLEDPGNPGVLYFAANDLVHGLELWRSDGTPAGTRLVSDLSPGTGSSNPAELTLLGGRLFFSADDGTRGGALWTSDGTAQGTLMVRDPLPNAAVHRGPSLLRAAGSTLYFAAPVTRRRDGLWKSGGTAGTTASFIDFSASAAASAFRDATVLAGRLLFVAGEPGRGQELWTSDGTRRGTVPLTRFSPAAPFLPLSSSNARLLPEKALGSRMVFRANDGPRGAEPWITDGTPGGTRLLRDLCPGPCSGAGGTDDAGLASLAGGEVLLFPGNDGVRGLELWATDGTAAGTRLVRDLCRGSCSSAPAPPVVGEGEAFFLAANTSGTFQLWRSDGTSRGTTRLTSFQRSASLAVPAPGVLLNGAFFFGADDGDNGHGRELWRSGGTVETTRLFLDINLDDFGGSFPTEFRAADGKAWFFANDGVHGSELWASDGTEEGTGLVHEFFPGEGPGSSLNVESAAESGGRIFFLLQLQETSFSLWRSEGTPGSTLRLSPPGLQILASEPLRAAGGQVFFVAAETDRGEELWASDGTPEGTRRVADLVAGPEGSEPRSLTAFQGRLYFTAAVEETGRELWATDGTPGGTVLVKDIDSRPGRGSEPRLLTEHAGRLYFPAADEEHGLELWSSDGTAAGTQLAVEITPGPDGVFMTHFLSSGSRLFFSGGPASITSQGLWVSDGTPAGTRQLSRKLIHIDPRAIGAPGVFNGDLYFASDGDEVLWRSDGTEEGTGPLRNTSGLEIDEPEAFQAFAGRLFFTTGQDSVLYQTEGTEETTSVVVRLAAPFESAAEAASFELVTAGGRLLFRRWDRLTGSELWALEAD